MLIIATSPRKINCQSGECLPFWRQTCLRFEGHTPPSGDSMKKCHNLAILDCLVHFTTKKRRLKPVGRTPVHQRPKFNPLHQETFTVCE